MKIDIQGLRKQARRDRNFIGSASTTLHYERRWERYSDFCSENGLLFLSFDEFAGDMEAWADAESESVCLYLLQLEARGCKPSTVNGYLSAFRKFYGMAMPPTSASSGVVNPSTHPVVKRTRAAILRRIACPVDKVAGFTAGDVVDMVKAIDDYKFRRSTIPGRRAVREGWRLRSRMLLLLAFCGFARRSELVALEISEVTIGGNGMDMRIFVPKSKRDQFRVGRVYTVSRGRYKRTCPVRAMVAWLAFCEAHGVVTGRVLQQLDIVGYPKGAGFEDGRVVADIFKALAARIGLDPDLIAGHSTRAGGATELLLRGIDYVKVADMLGWRSVVTGREYNRRIDVAAAGMTKVMGL